MANWSNPTLTSLYTDFVTEVKNRDVDLALGLDPATTSPTNVPANAIRWNSANSRWEKYTSGSWGTLTATYALTSLSLTGSITFEGATDDAFETTLTVADPTADRTITLPNVSGTVVTTGDTGSITSTMIADGTVVNADISASAAIAHSKLANITAGQVLLGNASNIPTATALSGDVTIDSSGVTAIGSGVIVNADINASAAIADTKLATISTAGKVDGTALTGTIPSAVLSNSNTFVGTTSIALNRASANQGLTGISSIALPGATSGTITVTPAATAGSTAITIPATSGTLVTTGDSGTITSAMIADGTIVNADVNASAAIAGTKISPDFGSQNVTTTGTSTAAGFIPSSATVPSNGLYLPAANQLGFSTASTSRLVVDASGNLGLGAVPSAWNASSKVFQVSQAAIESRSNGVVLANNGYYNSSGSWIYQNTSAAGLYNIAGNAHIWYTAPSGTAGGAITFTQAMTLDASGNLGIGTTAPYASLEVQGTQQTHTGVSSQVGPVAAYNTTNNADTAAVRTVLSLMRAGKSGVSYGSQVNFNIGRYSQANANANTQLNLRLANGVTNDPDNDVMTWLGDGRVGIGTTSPGYTLDVANSVIQVGTSTDAFVQYKSTAGNWHVGANSSNAYVFYSGTYGSGTERARIDSSGRLLVGTDTDSGGALLQINGDRIRVATAKTPASATATGTAGEVCWDANYIYVCTATNTWKRAAIATW